MLTRFRQVWSYVRICGERVFHFWWVEWTKRHQRHHCFGTPVRKTTAKAAHTPPTEAVRRQRKTDTGMDPNFNGYVMNGCTSEARGYIACLINGSGPTLEC